METYLQGTVLGKIEFTDQPIEFEDPNIRNLIAEVSTKVTVTFHKIRTTIYNFFFISFEIRFTRIVTN